MIITHCSIFQTIKNKISIAMFFLIIGICASVPRGTLAYTTDDLNAYQFGIRWNAEYQDIYVDDNPSFTERIINALNMYMADYPNNRVFCNETSYFFHVDNLRTLLAPLATTPAYCDIVCYDGEILYIKLSKQAFDNYNASHFPTYEEYYTAFVKCAPDVLLYNRFAFSDNYGYFNYSDGIDKYAMSFNSENFQTYMDANYIGHRNFYAITSAGDNVVYFSNAVRRFLLDEETRFLYLYPNLNESYFGSDRALWRCTQSVITYDLDNVGGVFQTQTYLLENVTAYRVGDSGSNYYDGYLKNNYNSTTLEFEVPVFVRFNSYNAIDHPFVPSTPTPSPAPTPDTGNLPTPQAWATPTPAITYTPIEDLPSHSEEFTNVAQFDHVSLYVFVMNSFMDTEIGLLMRWILGFTAFLSLLGFVPRFIDKENRNKKR